MPAIYHVDGPSHSVPGISVGTLSGKPESFVATLLATNSHTTPCIPVVEGGDQNNIGKIVYAEASSYTTIYPLNTRERKHGHIGERRVRTTRLQGGKGGNIKTGRGESHGPGLPEDLGYVLPDLVDSYEDTGGSKDGAQVHPSQFTMSIWVQSNRTACHPASLLSQDSRRPANPNAIIRVSELQFPSGSSRRKVSGISYTDTQSGTCSIPATPTILPVGPWMSRLFPSALTSRLRTQSATTTPSSPVSGYAICAEITTLLTPPPSLQNTHPSNAGSPEICARSNNEIYVPGEGDIAVAHIPYETTEDVNIDETRCDDLIAPVSSTSGHLRLGHRPGKQALRSAHSNPRWFRRPSY
ncbi:hypothetical protein HOY80DRAFT_1020782 [Tuber brumale]|nr:hypothetical protein HOY80DRAFT_1020782 [Tuber brumale]